MMGIWYRTIGAIACMKQLSVSVDFRRLVSRREIPVPLCDDDSRFSANLRASHSYHWACKYNDKDHEPVNVNRGRSPDNSGLIARLKQTDKRLSAECSRLSASS